MVDYIDWRKDKETFRKERRWCCCKTLSLNYGILVSVEKKSWAQRTALKNVKDDMNIFKFT